MSQIWQQRASVWSISKTRLLLFIVTVTFLQVLTSSFAAYAFAKMQLQGQGYIVPLLYWNHCYSMADYICCRSLS